MAEKELRNDIVNRHRRQNIDVINDNVRKVKGAAVDDCDEGENFRLPRKPKIWITSSSRESRSTRLWAKEIHLPVARG